MRGGRGTWTSRGRSAAFRELPSDLWERVFAQLDVRSLLRASEVCAHWKHVAGREPLWRGLCSRLWAGKAYVPKRFLDRAAAVGARKRYFESIADASRVVIERDELCSLHWYFRFKRAAGSHWIRRDPYWAGSAARAVSFAEDGSLRNHDGQLEDLRWAFVPTPQAAAPPSSGRAVAVGSGQLDFPPELAHRQPDWGWCLNSAWVVYSTTKMELASAAAHGLSDAQLRALVRPSQWAEAQDYNQRWLQGVDGAEVCSDDDSDSDSGDDGRSDGGEDGPGE